MAITATHMTDGSEDVDATLAAGSVSSASVAFANNRLYVVTFSMRGGVTPDVTAVSGGGGSWSKTTTTRGTAPFMAQYKSLVTSGATTGALTYTISGSPTTFKWTVEEFDGVNTTTPIVQTAAFVGGSNGGLNVTLSAFGDAVNNVAYGVACTSITESSITVDPSGGWSQMCLNNTVTAGTQTLFSEVKTGEDLTVTCTFPNQTSNIWSGNALEIAMATATASPTLYVNTPAQRW